MGLPTTFGNCPPTRQRRLPAWRTHARPLEYDCVGAKRPADFRLSIGSGECARVVVRYAPANADADVGSVKLQSDDPDRPTVIVPIAMADAAQLTVCAHDAGGARLACDGANGAPPSVPFGVVTRPGTLMRIVRLKNEGKGALDISGISNPSGAQATDYVIDTSKVPAKLLPGATADVQVTFKPQTAGSRKAWVEVDSGDPLRPALQIPLLGQGDGPAVCASEDPLDFGAANIGTTVEKVLTLTSCGTAPVQLLQPSFGALSSTAFSAKAALPGPQTLAVGAHLDVTLLYEPDQIGATIGSLLTPTPDQPAAYAELRGSGIDAPVCRLDAATLNMDFGQVVRGQFSEKVVTLANRGKADCHLKGLAITQGAATFTVTDPITNSIPLRTGDVFTFTLRYTPAATGPVPSTDTGTATADSDDPLRPKLDVKLTGNTVGAPSCKLSVAPQAGGFFGARTLQFGNVSAGKPKVLPVTFTNTVSSTGFALPLAFETAMRFSASEGAPPR